MSKTSSSSHISLGLSLTAGVGAVGYLLLANHRKRSSVAAGGDDEKEDTRHHYLVAGDIGGTNSRLAVYVADDGDEKKDALVTMYYENEKAMNNDKSFEEAVLRPFLEHCFAQSALRDRGSTLDNSSVTACLACAGPAQNNCVRMTNIENRDEVVIDGATMEADDVLLGCVQRVRVVNDFVGMGYGALTLDLDVETKELVPGSKALVNPVGPKVCVGAGTGLGECYLTVSSLDPESSGYECYPSEGGHVEFSPRDEVQIDLLRFLMKRFEARHRVSVERIVSGRGLVNVYDFLCEKFPERIDPVAHAAIEAENDLKGKMISVHSMKDNGDDSDAPSLCRETMNIFASAYGSEVGAAAVKFIPTGGLYVVGGLTPRNMRYIEGEDSPFMKAYRDKGRVSYILNDVPLFAVLDDDLGLRGARVCAQREYGSWRKQQSST